MENIKVLITEEEISKKVKELGKQISSDNAGTDLVVIAVLKGAFIFMADLVRALSIPCEMDFMQAKSYVGTTSSGVVHVLKDVEIDVSGKNVIVVEDILDTGRTLKAIKETLLAKNANSVKICTFLDKKARRVVDIEADYFCYEIPDNFVVGYGLDHLEKYRNLPFVGHIIQNSEE